MNLEEELITHKKGYYRKLTGFYVSKEYTDKIRRVKFYDKETKRTFIYLTNNMELLASEIALLYKNRWQVVELFFKWIKQHLKIKSFWGTSENAVRIQVYSAIIAFCLVVIAGRELKSNVSVRGTASKLYLGLSVTFVKA